MNALHTPVRRQAGFTLMELLIAMTVALVATLVIAQSFAIAEGYRRTGTTGGDANFSGAVGAYLMNSDLNAAGYGINTSAVLGCAVQGVDEQPPTGAGPRNFAFNLLPVQITPGANAQTPDSLVVVASNSSETAGPLLLAAAMASPTDNFTVTSAFGVNTKDLLLIAPGGVGSNCYIAQATNTPMNQGANQNVILHAAGAVADRYNPTGGLAPAMPANTTIFDMGPTPIVDSYYILNKNLMVDQIVAGELQQPVAPNIVQLKAFYGLDTVGDGAVHAWTNVSPTTSATWATVLAVRVALVAQSANPEKPNALGVCATTTVLPSVTWDDGTQTTLDVSVTGSTATLNWQCFRYKVFHVTTSLRNIIWKTS